MKRPVIWAVAAATLLILFVGLATAIVAFQAYASQAQPRKPLAARLDRRGPYVILATVKASKTFEEAIDRARSRLHRDAHRATFDPADLSTAREVLEKHRPRYALVFIAPEELDVNFGWRWLRLSTELDDDPFVDVRSGFITGATPEAATAFVERIVAAARGRSKLPGRLIDNLGPNQQIGAGAFQRTPGCFFVDVYGERLGLETISHGTAGFTDEQLGALDSAGIVHLGGHGYPDRIVDGLAAQQSGRLKLAPCVVFNGACYTGVTDRWYDFAGSPTLRERRVPADECFCLQLLGNRVIAYLAALHPDHGIPVYQEMEYLAFSGASLGNVIKHTHDGVVLGSGGRLPEFETLRDGAPRPRWTPSEIMLKGTAARVLFGDPALVVTDAFTEEPFRVAVRKLGDSALEVTATLENPRLKSTFTDTYHADLASDKRLFNDCARIEVPLPSGWDSIGEVAVVAVTAGDESLKHRLVGHGVEIDGRERRLHVQVDVPTSGYMKSELRRRGARVVLRVRR